MLLDDIIDYKQNENAVDKSDAFITMKNGVRCRIETTQGWSLLCQWKDGSSNWIALNDARLSYPVLVAEYAIANRIDNEPAFAWWVHDVLTKRDQIIAKVKSKYWQQTHKLCIQIPKTVKEALQFDKKNGNNLWWEAICQGIKNV